MEIRVLWPCAEGVALRQGELCCALRCTLRWPPLDLHEDPLHCAMLCCAVLGVGAALSAATDAALSTVLRFARCPCTCTTTPLYES